MHILTLIMDSWTTIVFLCEFFRLEKNMIPPSESTNLESTGQFIEYVGSGKLKDKKVLITGGE